MATLSGFQGIFLPTLGSEKTNPQHLQPPPPPIHCQAYFHILQTGSAARIIILFITAFAAVNQL